MERKDAAGRPVWWVRLYHDGRIRWFGSFKSRKEAREFYQEAKADQRRGKFFPERFQRGGAKLSEVIDAYMKTNSKRTLTEDARYADFWKARLPEARLRTLTPTRIDEVKDELLSKGLANQTVVHYLKFLRHVLNVAVRDRKLGCKPSLQVTRPKVSTGKVRFLSLAEEKRLCEAIGPKYAPWVRFAILTGLRREEQFRLKWADLDVERGLITLPATKAGDVQYVQLNAEALDIITCLMEGNKSVWVFPSQKTDEQRKQADTPVDQDNFYRRIYQPALRQAVVEGVTWHALRHTFASRLAMAGATEGDIAACLRHSTTALVRRYAHLSPTHLRGVIEKVSAFGKVSLERSKPEACVEKGEIADLDGSAGASQAVGKIGAGDGSRTRDRRLGNKAMGVAEVMKGRGNPLPSLLLHTRTLVSTCLSLPLPCPLCLSF